MPVKYFCDECGVEVVDPSASLDMTGKILCGEHYAKYLQSMTGTKWTYEKKWDADRFRLPNGIKRCIDG